LIHNENKLQAYRDPVESLKTSSYLTNVLGGLLIIVGVLSILPLTNSGYAQEHFLWEGYLSLVFGLLVLSVSFVNRKTATTASLKIVAVIVILQTVALDIFSPIISENGLVDFKGLLLSVLILGTIFKSIKSLNMSLEKA
jgi:uncharacterized membrane protein HdeD (DUF308 family)